MSLNPLIAFISLAVLGLGINFGLNEYIQFTLLLIMVNCLMAMSLNLVNGYTGQFSLGHAGFMAIGAYFAAYASTKWNFLSSDLQFISSFIFVLGGGLLAAFAGFLVGLPSLRLKGDYLAIVTLGFGEIIRVALLNMDFVGGPRGYANIPAIGSFISSYLFACIWILICFLRSGELCVLAMAEAF